MRDVDGKWLPAQMVDIRDSMVTVHFLDYSDKFNETLDWGNATHRKRVATLTSLSGGEETKQFGVGERLKVRRFVFASAHSTLGPQIAFFGSFCFLEHTGPFRLNFQEHVPRASFNI